jgi:hypothetical protein
MTIDDPAVLERQVAYLDRIRTMGRRERTLGLVVSLIGVLIIVVARFRLAGEPWALWSGVAVVVAGWGLFIVSIGRRILWVRAHPFDPNALDPNG